MGTKKKSFPHICTHLNVVILLLSAGNTEIPTRAEVICFLGVLCTVQCAACLSGNTLACKLSYMETQKQLVTEGIT